jgi:hypothetical protein
MIKKLLLGLILLGFLGISGFIYFKLTQMPEQTIPYPYTFTIDPLPKVDPGSNIVLMGDDQGKKFAQFLPHLEETLGQGLKSKIKVHDLTQKHEGMHRTLQKLRSFSTLPKIILYLGGTEEFYEQKFHKQDLSAITTNFKKYDSKSVQTLLLFSPLFSKFIYGKVERIPLKPVIMKNIDEYSDTEIFLQSEVVFKIYENEFKEFVEYIKSKDSILVVISAPLNPDKAPTTICPTTISDEYVKFQPELDRLYKNKDYKMLASRLKELLPSNQGNALMHFYHGQALKNIGLPKEAKQEIELARIYDCSTDQMNPIINKIQKSITAKYEAFYFDFNQMLFDSWGENEIFLDDNTPQALYYEKSNQLLGSMLKKYLKL